MKYDYIGLLLGILVFTVILENIFRIHLYKSRKERYEIVAFFFVIFTICDTFAVSRGDWTFPDGHTVGLKIGILPLEEYLFFIIIPYFIITIYKTFDSKIRPGKKKK